MITRGGNSPEITSDYNYLAMSLARLGEMMCLQLEVSAYSILGETPILCNP